MAEKNRYDVLGVEVDGSPILDLWVKPGKEHMDATSGSLMLGNTQVATTTWGWKRGYDKAYVGTWLANQESAYVRRGLNGHALDYACKVALEQLHNDRLNSSKTTAQTTQQITMEVASWISGKGATAQVTVNGKTEDKFVDGITQPQALLGAVIMGLKKSDATVVTILTRDAWLAQVWQNQSFKKNLNYWSKIFQLIQGRQMIVKYVGGGQPIMQQQSEPPIQQQKEEDDIPPMDEAYWDGILDYNESEEVLPE